MNFVFHCIGKVVLVLVFSWPVKSTEFINLRFLKEPQDSALANNDLILPCLVNRNEGIYSWLYKSQKDQQEREISSSPFRLINKNGSLTLKKSEQVFGFYRCQVSIPGYGIVVSKEAEVKKAELIIESIPADQSGQGSYFKGDMVLLNCKVTSWPEKFTVEWFKVVGGDHKPVSCNINSLDYVCHNEGQSLEIKSLYDGLVGKYFCRATSSIDPEWKVSGEHLAVSLIPLTDSTDRVSALKLIGNIQEPRMWVLSGRSITLICGANGQLSDGTVPSFSWKHNKNDAIEHDRRKIVGRSSLKITNISVEDRGRYNCHINLGHEFRTVELILQVGQPPSYAEMPQNVRGHFQESLVLSCRVSGTPQPLIEWRKNGEVLTPSDDIFQETTGDLRIVSFLTADVGIFQCLARNRFGSIQTAVQVLESASANDGSRRSPDRISSSKVKPPVELEVNVRDKWLSLTWKAPQQSEYLDLSYIITIMRKESERVMTMKTNYTRHIVGHLLPETNYTIQVFTQLSDGSRSLPVTKQARTLKSPKKFPDLRNLRADIAKFGELRISWDHSILGYKHLTQYKIILVNLSESENLRFKNTVRLTVQPNRKSVLVQNLTPDAFYRISVYGENDEGYSKGIIQSSPRVPCKPPSGPPQNVRVSLVKSHSFTISWSPPPRDARNGQIFAYFVNIKSDDINKNVKLTSPITRYTFKDLNKNQIYRLSVAAATRGGTGPFSNTIEVKTTSEATMLPQKSSHQLAFRRSSAETADGADSVPGKVVDLSTEAYAHSVKVSWKKPKGGTSVTYYKIFWGLTHPNEHYATLNRSTTEYTIKNLSLGQTYVVKVTAGNNYGEGEQSMNAFTTIDRTENPRLEIPMNLVVGDIRSTDVSLSWQPPDSAYPSYHTYQVKWALMRGDRDSPSYKNVSEAKTLITGLLPASKYEIAVRSIHPNKPKKYWSNWSLMVNFDTLGEKPTDFPQDLTVSRIKGKSSSLQLSWQPPEFPNGRITNYVIEVLVWDQLSTQLSDRKINTNDQERDVSMRNADAYDSEYNWSERKVAGETLNMVINLKYSTIYLFRIFCTNKYGNSKRSFIKIYKMPDENGQGGGPILLHKDIKFASEMPREKLTPSEDPSWKPGGIKQYSSGGLIGDHTWWAIIGGVFGVAMLLISTTLIAHFCFCRRVSQHNSYGSSINNRKHNNHHGKTDATENGKVTPLLNKPDLFIHTESQQFELERRNSDSVGRHSDADNDSNHFTSVSQRQFSSDCPGGFSPGSSSGGGINMTSPYTSQPHQNMQTPFYPAGGASGAPMMQVNQQQMLISALQQQQRHQRMGSLNQAVKPKSMLLPQMDPMVHNNQEAGMAGFHQMGSMGRGMMMMQHPPVPMQPQATALRPPVAQMRVGGAPPPRVNASELASHTSSEDIRPLMQASSMSEGSKNGGSVPAGQNNSGAPSRRGSSHVKRKPPSGATPTSQPKHSSSSGAPTPQRGRHDRGDMSATSSEAELQKGLSAEELCQEMLNLEGLMKDLNAITQKEFEC